MPDGRAVMISMAEARGHCCNIHSMQHTEKMRTVMVPHERRIALREEFARGEEYCHKAV